MQHRIVPDDNSCLFSSIGIVFKGGYSDSVTNQLRQSESREVELERGGFGAYELVTVVADEIRKDEIEYPEVVLG